MKRLSLQQIANILKVVAFIIFIAIIMSVIGCSSSREVAKSKTQKYYDKVVQHKQFAIVNNQIIIFENN
jgi:hypothetical protein